MQRQQQQQSQPQYPPQVSYILLIFLNVFQLQKTKFSL